MGTRLSHSRTASASAPRSAEEDAAQGLESFNLSQPTAAVVGAGMAGVHVAHELAELGFRVTVFDERAAVGEGGGTQFGLPFVGVGLLEPAFATLPVRRAVCTQMLLPSTCPALITREHWWNVVGSPFVRRWLWARAHAGLTPDEVMWHTDNLARLSVAVVHELLAKYPELHRYVVGPTRVGRLSSARDGATAVGWTATRTAHAAPLLIDPVGWSRALAEVCVREKGVRFVLRERVERVNLHLGYDVEDARSLTTSHAVADATGVGTRAYATHGFDVVVLTAGPGTPGLMWGNVKLPVLGLRGWSVALSRARGELAAALRRLFPPESADETAALVRLSAPCQLFGYRVGAEDAAYRLCGLLSLDTSVASTPATAQQQLERMEAYVRVYCNANLPLVHTQAQMPETVQVTDYVRAFSADGVPLVDRCGLAFNAFVCSGFGDHTSDFAPGAAKLLRNLVERQAHALLETDRAHLPHESGAASPPSRLPALQREWRTLLHGVLPRQPACESNAPQDGRRGRCRAMVPWLDRWWAPRAPHETRAAEDTVVTFASLPERTGMHDNPFACQRFARRVKHDHHYRTLDEWLREFEDACMRVCSQLSVRCARSVAQLALDDKLPEVVRAYVVRRFETANEEEQRVARERRLQEGMQRLIRAREHGTTSELLERSFSRQTHLQEAARQSMNGHG